jgi:hypothetical protein
MKRILAILLLAAAVFGAYWLWGWMHPPPEKVIRRQMNKLADSLSTRAEGNIARAAAVNRTLSLFTSDVFINGEGMSRVGESISGKTELQQALFAARKQLEGEVTFEEIHVTVGPEQTNAVVTFSAVARLVDQSQPYSQDIKAQFQKIDGNWLIARVDPINPITAPP